VVDCSATVFLWLDPRLVMKITIACKYFSPRGGAQTFLFNLARSLLGEGHGVRVLTMEIQDPPEGVDVRLVKIPPVPKTLRDWAFARAVEKTIKADDADVTFGEQKCWGTDVVRPGGGVHREYIAQIVKAYPTRLQRTWQRATRRFRLKEMLNHHIEKRLYRPPGPRLVVANSDMVRRHLLKHYPHLEGRLRLVYNGTDCRRFNPSLRERYRQDVRRDLKIPPDALVAVFVSFDWRRKGLTSAVRALSLLRRRASPREVYLIIVGKGKRLRVELLARGLGVADRLRFVGVAPPDRFYGAGDVSVLPTYFDPCANATIEGLACGLPAITTVHNGAHELLTQGVDGFVLEDPADAETLADHLEYFMDEARLAAARRAARERGLAHTLPDMYAQIRDALLEVAAMREQARRSRR